MIPCDFQLRGDLSLCEYLYNTIKELVRGGSLKENEKLPSKRSLASHLGVSVITVANAYARLISEGYMYSVEKKGFFAASDYVDVPEASPHVVQTRESSAHDNERHTDFAAGVLSRESSAVGEPALESSVHGGKHKLLADFRTNSINVDKFPFSVWNAAMRDVLKEPHESLLRSPPPQGVYELRREIAEYLRCFRDMDVDPSQIIIGAGTEYITFIVVSLFGRNAVYCVENPGYRKIASVFQINGARCVPVNVDDEGIDVRAVREYGASVVHVSPSHHFPTGTVMSLNRRRELLSWAAADENHFIIEDDYDSEFLFTGRPLETLFGAASKRGAACGAASGASCRGTADDKACGASYGTGAGDDAKSADTTGDVLCAAKSADTTGDVLCAAKSADTTGDTSCGAEKNGNGAGHVIYTNTFSKTLSPSYRISYMVLPPPLAEKFRKNNGFLTCPVSVFEQSALSRFMQNGSYEKHIIRMKNYYRNLRNSLIQSISASPLAHISSIREQNAGLHFLLEFNAPVSGKRLQRSFLENGLDIPLLSEYWIGAQSTDTENCDNTSVNYSDRPETCDNQIELDKPVFVMNYSGISREVIPEAVARMNKAIKSVYRQENL